MRTHTEFRADSGNVYRVAPVDSKSGRSRTWCIRLWSGQMQCWTGRFGHFKTKRVAAAFAESMAKEPLAPRESIATPIEHEAIERSAAA